MCTDVAEFRTTSQLWTNVCSRVSTTPRALPSTGNQTTRKRRLVGLCSHPQFTLQHIPGLCFTTRYSVSAGISLQVMSSYWQYISNIADGYRQWLNVKVTGATGDSAPCSDLSPCNSMSPLIESIKCYFMPK